MYTHLSFRLYSALEFKSLSNKYKKIKPDTLNRKTEIFIGQTKTKYCTLTENTEIYIGQTKTKYCTLTEKQLGIKCECHGPSEDHYKWMPCVTVAVARLTTLTAQRS